MSLALACLMFVLALGLVLYAAEKLVLGTMGLSLSFGWPSFLISVLFVGFDPKNLAVGATGAYEGVYGIALGSIIGAAMVAVALVLGIKALICPLEFASAPKRLLALPPFAVLLFGALGFDGTVSRVDGLILLLGFVLSVFTMIRASKKGQGIKPAGEAAECLEEAGKLGKIKALGVFALSLATIVAGSELLVLASKTILSGLRISDTVFGMIIVSFLVNVEKLARELPAALKGGADIAYGNVTGSVLTFFLFNAGMIALVHPVRVERTVETSYLLVCFLAVFMGSLFLARERLGRAQGAILVLLYAVFLAMGMGRGAR
mgnify:CR=1 FL=1